MGEDCIHDYSMLYSGAELFEFLIQDVYLGTNQLGITNKGLIIVCI